MDSPGVRLIPERLELQPTTGGRAVDLGFAEFRLPERLSTFLVRHDESLFVSAAEGPEAKPVLTICPPAFEGDHEVQSLLGSYAELTGVKLASYHELELEVLSAQPFSVWSVPFRGVRSSIRDAALLTMKSLTTSGATKLNGYANERFQVVVTTLREMTEVKLTDKERGVSQSFLLANVAEPPDELVSCLVRSYRFKSASNMPDQLLAQLAATGMHQRVTVASASNDTSESRRLEEVANAVRDRRLRRNEGMDAKR
jgi:hypothetical protein